MLKYKGTLIPVGGNENKGDDEYQGKEFIQEGILAQVVKEAGGNNAIIVIIPTASSIPDEVADNYLEAFGKLDCTNLHILNIQSREDAESSRSIELVGKADCLMFSGGDQSNITLHIKDTTFHKIMIDRLKSDTGFVIAGTSAGAMMMSTEMIAGGSATDALQKGNVLMGKGMELTPSFIIDSHFTRRGRFGRLAEALSIHPHLMGIGLSEDTGLIIKHGSEFKVIGTGMVFLLDASQLTHNNQKILKEGVPMTLSNLITHILANGDRFFFEDKKIAVQPMQENTPIDK